MSLIVEWLDKIFPPLMGALGMIAVGLITGRTNLSAKKFEATTKRVEGATPSYEALDERVVKLENQVGELRSRVEHLQDENGELKAFAFAEHLFIEKNISPSIIRPFNRPSWIDREDRYHKPPSSDPLETQTRGILQNGV